MAQKILFCFGDGALELNTNLVENMFIRNKLGMKDWMFFGSLEAGRTTHPSTPCSTTADPGTRSRRLPC
ncbi:hypothetical protein HZ994_14605 [Akkermansiaceae bacterium]|nr:hypothetical protein HZ994_14605 [Akkermansiaceae bacterium]